MSSLMMMGSKSRLTRKLIAADLFQHLFHRKMQTICDFLRIGIEVAHLVAQQQRGEGWIVVDDQLPIAIIDFVEAVRLTIERPSPSQ